MDIGENIRHLRQNLGLSQAEFAQRMDVTKETVSRWESGRSFIRRNNIEKIRTVFGVPVEHLLGEVVPTRQDVKLPVADGASRAEGKAAQGEGVFPAYKVDRSASGTMLRYLAQAMAPADVAQRHPASFFVRLDSVDLAKVYPQGCLLLADQRMRPYNGCTVVAIVDDSITVIRRFQAGNNTVVLSTLGLKAPQPDLVLDKRRVRILGTVVWFQAGHDVTPD